jgi:hypothetical protein
MLMCCTGEFRLIHLSVFLSRKSTAQDQGKLHVRSFMLWKGEVWFSLVQLMHPMLSYAVKTIFAGVCSCL